MSSSAVTPSGNGFRPPQWSRPALTSITANLPASGAASAPGADAQQPAPTTLTTYIFDAIFRLDHSQELILTEHPVQGGTAQASGGSAASGGSIVDHAYLRPSDLSMEIGMSDAMDSYTPGQWSGSSSSKSVNAYETLLNLQQLRIPLTIVTRLKTYSNMVIRYVRAPDDNRTLRALRVSVQFRQIIAGVVGVTTQSARPSTTTTTNPGTAQPEAVPQELQKYLDQSGQWSSNAPNVVN